VVRGESYFKVWIILDADPPTINIKELVHTNLFG